MGDTGFFLRRKQRHQELGSGASVDWAMPLELTAKGRTPLLMRLIPRTSAFFCTVKGTLHPSYATGSCCCLRCELGQPFLSPHRADAFLVPKTLHESLAHSSSAFARCRKLPAPLLQAMEPSQPKSVADSIEDWTKNLDIDSLLSHVDSGLLGGGVLSASEAEMLGSTDFLTGSTLAASDIQYSIDLPTLGDDTVSSSSSWLAGEVMGQASRVLEQPFLPSPPTGAIDIPKGHMGTEQASRDRNTLRSENQTPPKIGKRFSSGTSRILKSWLADHIHQPYPTFQDVQLIQQQTGLTRQQIVTWFRNARRYRKAQGTPSQWPIARQMDDVEPEDTANALEQPLPFHDMSPLQRWQNSPPEHEPATASAIAQASSQIQSRPLSRAPTPIDKAAFTRSWRDDSSASSAATSQLSNSSLGSAWSGESRLRCPELKPKKVKRRKRRRPLVFKPETGRCSSLNPVCHTFQCTFCTETFATKHNWQRHEKSLHLSLEQWECSPQGPIFQNANSEPACTYCGQPNPAHDHLMAHNYAFCHKRSAEERLFSRKDHLQQHLKLVHEASFVQVPMEQWKRQAQTLRSRCGFCDITMDTWADRADHLADHFKKGKSMADWKGDWGFEGHVLSIVENSMPPCMCIVVNLSRLVSLVNCLLNVNDRFNSRRTKLPMALHNPAGTG